MVNIDRNGLEVLERGECLALLDKATVGRIAFTSQALPWIVPVNFLRDGDRILIRTGEGTKLALATVEAVVGFEVDEVDDRTHAGWSVVVVGVARRLDDDEVAALGREVPRWAPGRDGHVVSIGIEVLSGRRLHALGDLDAVDDLAG